VKAHPRVPFLLAALVAASCSSGPANEARPVPSPGPVQTVSGYATEIEFGDLSLRTLDGRSLIFTLENAPLPVAQLEKDMAELKALRVTYRAEAGSLIPLRIEELCPGPECPPPYTQPRPSNVGEGSG
jgi:hypothetical protein